MDKKIFIVFFSFLYISATSKKNMTNPNGGQNLEEVPKILSQISDFYNNLDNFEISFKITKNDPNDPKNIEEINGTIITEIDKKIGTHKYILNIDGTLTINDGETKWIYVKSINEVTICDYDPNDEDEKLFLRIKNTLLNPTEYYVPEYYESKDNIDIIEMVPVVPYEDEIQDERQSDEENDNEDNIVIDRIVLNIDHSTKEVKSWTIIDNENGISYNYDIIQFTPNIEIKKDFFRFDTEKYENLTINDLRLQ